MQPEQPESNSGICVQKKDQGGLVGEVKVTPLRRDHHLRLGCNRHLRLGSYGYLRFGRNHVSIHTSHIL
ncbi:unnamed protein product [Toxocara canis]|uniref:Uncharacterized protein n=1 Tax=Toxocara canis TaxID=6265 RepID=A0A183U0K0_TOXCA|nr:unnamed protein product [Toxocara canis]